MNNSILGFSGEYRWLSNFAQLDYPIEINGALFKTSENAYQAMKCKNESDFVTFQEMTAAESKKMGRLVEQDPSFQENKLVVMKTILDLKFRQESFKRKLLETGGRYIEETNFWHDNFFGNCNCDECKDVIGLNHLGKIITEIRNDLRKE